MSRPPYLSVVLPAYNEAESLPTTLRAMRTFLEDQGYGYEIIVASDGDDDTPRIIGELARDWPELRLSAQPGRHGKGHGLRRGVALASGEVIGFIDADYQTAIDEVAKVLPYLREGYQLAIGSRRQTGSRIDVPQPVYRQIGSRVFAFGMHLVVGLGHIRDTQCGFKFFTRDAARAIFRRTKIDGYMCDVEILWLAQRLGYRIKEVGVRWRDDGDTRSNLVRSNLQSSIDLLRIRFNRY